METFLFYILRISIASGILYAFYKLLLSRNILHSYNRLVILFFYVSSLVTAWVTIDYSWMFPKKEVATLDLSQFNATTATAVIPVQQTTEINWLKIISVLYVIGFAVFVTIFLISFSKMILIVLKSKKSKLEGNITLCISDAEVSPFSWMNYLVISKSDYTNDNQPIIFHETAHIQYHHSWDMMLANTYLLFTWFNPFAWLLRKELQTIHEYQADKKVISAGADAKEYQLLLIRKCVGEKKFMLANNFEYNHLQKRIKMIMKTNSVKQKRGIYALIPILLMVISTVLSAENLQSKIKLTKESFDLQKDSIRRELKVVNIGDTTFVTETVNGVVTTSKMIGKESFDSIKGRKMILMDEDEIDGKKTTKKIIIIKDSTNSDIKPLFILDGKVISSEEMKDINHEDIESINVYKGDKAFQLCGEKGKNGVVDIMSKKMKIKLDKDAQKSLYIVDGVYSNKKVADDINPSDIITIDVLKGDNALKLYGDEGKNGVICITTKRYSADVKDSPVKDDVMNYIDKQKNKKLSSAKISNEGNKVITKGISDKNSAIFIDNQLADLKTLKKIDNSRIKTINIYPISSFPELAIKYNLHKERIVQVFTK